MDETNQLLVAIGADISGLRREMNEAVNLIQNTSRRINSSLESIGDIGNKISAVGGVLTAGLTVPIVGLGVASVNAYADIQALQKGLESITGSVSVANREFEKLKQVAKLPGIGLQEAVKGSINLQAIGLSANTSRKILLEFGNAIASVGKGRVEFERAIYGVTQLANTAKPLGEDLNIIADALPQVRTLLQDAFGKTRSDDLAKMGVSSKQVLDVILKGLGELPRVSGGIKNAFENLKDSLTQNLARVGKSIDTAFDISGLINKLTGFLDNLITRFENLTPATQGVVLGTTALVAAIGPLLLGLGSILALIPTLVSGYKSLRTAVLAVNTAMLANPYTAVAIGLLAIGSALAIYYAGLETAKDRQDRFNNSLIKAQIEARNEQQELATLYQKTQDQSLAIDERRKAVDLLQKQYPGYFANIKDEIILAGKAGETYRQLTVDITKASRARVAQSELDKRNTDRLEKELELRKKIEGANKVYQLNSIEAAIKFNEDNPFGGIDIRKGVRAGVKEYNKILLEELANGYRQANKEDKNLKKILEDGLPAIAKLDIGGFDKTIPGADPKVKKERERQIAEIYPIGSIKELQQRAELLQKAIETTNNDLVKVRGLDKFGKETNKSGQPYFTGEILGLETAYDRLQQINAKIDLLQPPELKAPETTALNKFKTDFSTLASGVQTDVIKIGESFLYLPSVIAFGVDSLQIEAERIKEATQKLNESLGSIINTNVSEGIADAFSAIGQTLVNGGNLFQSLGKSLVSSFGKILTDLGKQMIQYGVSMLAIKIAMKSLNPYVAIAAGAALVALGAGITASVSKQSDSIGGSSGSVSTSTGANAPTFSASNSSSQGFSGGEYVFRLSGQDLVATFNRNVSAEDRVNAG